MGGQRALSRLTVEEMVEKLSPTCHPLLWERTVAGSLPVPCPQGGTQETVLPSPHDTSPGCAAAAAAAPTRHSSSLALLACRAPEIMDDDGIKITSGTRCLFNKSPLIGIS